MHALFSNMQTPDEDEYATHVLETVQQYWAMLIYYYFYGKVVQTCRRTEDDSNNNTIESTERSYFWSSTRRL